VPGSNRAVPLRFLQSPAAWQALGVRCRQVRTVETRRSWVFLAGDRVLKLKKPVREPRLDFSTAARREQACREELRVNARFAPGVYLGLVALRGGPGAWHLDFPPGPGPARDWLVLMRRLQTSQMLDARIASRALPRAGLEALAVQLCAAWRAAPRPALSAADVTARFETELQRSVALLSQPRWAWLQALPVLQRCADGLRAGAALIGQRVAAGACVEGHGDLRPEHVWLPPGSAELAGTGPQVDSSTPLVIDALEFDPTLRLVDPFDELAYLALECRRLGAPWTGLRLLARCAHLLDDHPPHRLLRLYTGHRALLRARLALAHLLDEPVREPTRWRPLAAWYLQCADAVLSRAGATSGPVA
jgi:aminoglycoside phosphotransferase family enzyme